MLKNLQTIFKTFTAKQYLLAKSITQRPDKIFRQQEKLNVKQKELIDK